MLDGVGFDVQAGEVLGIIGPSGAGKSTLARLLVGLLAPSRGEIWVCGERLTTGARALRRRIQMVFQHPEAALDPRQTVVQAMAGATADTGRALRLLERVGIPKAALGRRPAELSGGQKQRLVLARALAVDPNVVVLDEPTSALDRASAARVLGLLSSMVSGAGAAEAQVLVTHDLEMVLQFAHRVLVLAEGRVVEEGTPARVFAEPAHPTTGALVDAARTLGLGAAPE